MKEVVSGIWVGEVTPEDYNGPRHGKWLIGNELPTDSPGHHPDLMYKRWKAQKGDRKYDPPGHTQVPPAHGGRKEFVKVMNGLFICEVGSEKIHLQYPKEGTDLGPEVKRTWVLPPGSLQAEGYCICRREPNQYEAGGGVEYEYYCFDTSRQDELFHLISSPLTLRQYRYTFIDLFAGHLNINMDSDSKPCRVQLHSEQHMFILGLGKWLQSVLPEPHTRGVVLHF